MPSETTGTLIAGAGPTGLGAAWRLDRLAREGAAGAADWLLCEAEAEAGGLASSVVDGHGFTWDLGGHVQFSHYQHFEDLMDELLGPEGWLYHERSSWVWTRGRFVPYPFQLNLRHLPPAERWECVRGLMRLQGQPPAVAPAHFGEWIDATFGAGVARVFLRPYNTKVWAYPPEELSWEWIGDRVAVTDVERVLENICRERDDVGWGPNNRFRFPRRGGTGAVWRELARRLAASHPGRLRFGWRLVRLDTARHEAIFDAAGPAEGETQLAAGAPGLPPERRTVRYERLLSTLPLDRLVALSDLGVPRDRRDQLERREGLGDEGPAGSDLAAVARALRRSATHVLGVGLHGAPGESLAGKSWIYFPEDDCPFYRVTVFSRYSPENVPGPGFWSLMAEVAESPARPVNSDTIAAETVAGMVSTRLISHADLVHHVWHRRLEHGYPTPALGRDAALAVLLNAFAERDVFSRGRFGAWKYEVSNQDHSFAQGVEAVERWFLGGGEETLNHPEVVNARRPRTRDGEGGKDGPGR